MFFSDDCNLIELQKTKVIDCGNATNISRVTVL